MLKLSDNKISYTNMDLILSTIVNTVNFVLNFCGIIFVLWGGLEAAVLVVWGDLTGKNDLEVEKRNRKNFASKLIIGMQFFIAVDILSVLQHSTWDSLGRLAALIAIRAALSLILNMEMKSFEKNPNPAKKP